MRTSIHYLLACIAFIKNNSVDAQTLLRDSIRIRCRYV